MGHDVCIVSQARIAVGLSVSSEVTLIIYSKK
jgi:hypothetical protein